jgi:hypothetical protein
VPRVEDTYFSKKYAADPKAKARHDAIFAKLQEAARLEREEIGDLQEGVSYLDPERQVYSWPNGF